MPALDELLAGGLPRGQLVEMIGGRSSGRFSAMLAAIAAATLAGEAAALVDLGDGLDPQAAADLGVDLRRLLWLRPTNLKQALAGAEILIGGGFQMVALDLGSPPVRGGRGVEAGWLRLARAAHANGTALLVASPYRMSGTAAAVVLQAARERTLWQGGGQGAGAPSWLLGGISCQVDLEKCRGRLLAARPAADSRQSRPSPRFGHAGRADQLWTSGQPGSAGRCRRFVLRLPETVPHLDSPLSADDSAATAIPAASRAAAITAASRAAAATPAAAALHLDGAAQADRAAAAATGLFDAPARQRRARRRA
jgi:hypothetical protein